MFSLPLPQLEIQIFEDLRLTSPGVPRNTLLMSPGSIYQLRTNRESAGDVTYTVVGGSCGSKAAGGGDLITVSRTGESEISFKGVLYIFFYSF